MPTKQQRDTALIQAPQLPKKPAATALPDAAMIDHGSYTDLALANLDLTDQAADDVLFERVQLKRVLLSRTRLHGSQLLDVRFDVCDFTGAEWEKPHLSRIVAVGCRMLGTKLFEAKIDNALLKDCNAAYAVFWSAMFQATRFEHCTFREASFQGADLSGVVFDGCDLTGADFRETKLVGTDLRGSKLDGLRVGIKELQGAIIDATQAVHLVTLLGITVK